MELNTQANQTFFWTAKDLHDNQNWVYHLGSQHREELVHAARAAYDESKDLLDYRKGDFALDITGKFLEAPP